VLARGSTYRVQYLVWTPESFFLFFPSYINQLIQIKEESERNIIGRNTGTREWRSLELHEVSLTFGDLTFIDETLRCL